MDDLGISEVPSTFYIPQEDEEQRKEINEEQAVISSATKILPLLLEWFDAEIAWAATIEGLDAEADIKAQLLAKQRVEKFMTEAKLRLIGMLQDHNLPNQ